MNQRITEITDELFKDIEMTAEAQALKDELTADLNDRFADLLSAGISEEEAAAQIRSDLADFGELTRRFPHRQHALMPVAPGSVPADAVDEIRISLKSDDLRVEPSPDGSIRLELTGDPEAQWRSELADRRLTLAIVRPEKDEAFRQEPADEPISLSAWLLRTLKGIAVNLGTETTCLGTVRIPAGWYRSLDAVSGSGDIAITVPLSSLAVRTGSGDVDIRAYDSYGQIKAGTGSGDVTLSATAARISIGTASGDVEARDGAADLLRVVTASGDADISTARARTLELMTTSGDITFQGEADRTEFKTVSGDVSLELSGPLSSVSGSAVSGDTDIILTDRQPADIQASSVSGDIDTFAQEGICPARIHLKSVSGDITVR